MTMAEAVQEAYENTGGCGYWFHSYEEPWDTLRRVCEREQMRHQLRREPYDQGDFDFE